MAYVRYNNLLIFLQKNVNALHLLFGMVKIVLAVEQEKYSLNKHKLANAPIQKDGTALLVPEYTVKKVNN